MQLMVVGTAFQGEDRLKLGRKKPAGGFRQPKEKSA